METATHFHLGLWFDAKKLSFIYMLTQMQSVIDEIRINTYMLINTLGLYLHY